MGSAPQSKHINLQSGWPTPCLCERQGLLEGAETALAESADIGSVLSYGPHQGYAPFRDEIAAWLYDVYQPLAGTISADRIMISGGASQNLANITLRFADPVYTRRIFMVEPTYFLACPIFEDCGFKGKLRGIPETLDTGLDLRYLESALRTEEDEAAARCRAAGQSDEPVLKTGDWLEIARRYDALLVSDDVYDFLSWPEDPAKDDRAVAKAPPRLIDIERELDDYSKFGNTASNGSFSKIVGPGVRVCWAESTPAFADALANVGSSNSGGAPSHLASTFVSHMSQTKWLQTHISRVLVPTYRRRYYEMMGAIKDLLVPLGFAIEVKTTAADSSSLGTAGGYFTYLRLPEDLPVAKALAAVALKQYNLRVAFGHMFIVSGDEGSLRRAEAQGGFASCIRLCWAWHGEMELREGLRRLADAVVDLRGRLKRGEDLHYYLSIGIR